MSKPTFKSQYAAKLKDPRWQKLRLEVMQRDGFQCLKCEAKDKPLHVHHLVYCDNPWESHMDQLETLCEDCHKSREYYQKLVIKELRMMPTWMAEDVMPVVYALTQSTDFALIAMKALKRFERKDQ